MKTSESVSVSASAAASMSVSTTIPTPTAVYTVDPQKNFREECGRCGTTGLPPWKNGNTQRICATCGKIDSREGGVQVGVQVDKVAVPAAAAGKGAVTTAVIKTDITDPTPTCRSSPGFRAAVTGIGNLVRPLQLFSNNESEVTSWGESMLSKYPGAIIRIYERLEVLRGSMTVAVQEDSTGQQG